MSLIYVCVVVANNEKFAQYTFALVMVILCMFIKLGVIYTGAHFFSSIGGAYSMEYHLNNAYEPLNASGDANDPVSQHSQPHAPSGYFPPAGQFTQPPQGTIHGMPAPNDAHRADDGAL